MWTSYRTYFSTQRILSGSFGVLVWQDDILCFEKLIYTDDNDRIIDLPHSVLKWTGQLIPK